MVRKESVYGLATFVWALVVAGVGILVISGQAEPAVSADLFPAGPIGGIGTVIGGVVVGAYAIDRVKARDWQSTGRAAGLSPSGGTLWGTADMEGSVQGTTVRARTIQRKKSSGGEGGSKSVTYTIVEADLESPAEDGLLLGRAPSGVDADPGESLDALGGDFGGVTTIDLGDGFWAVADDEDLARALVTDRVRNVGRELGTIDGAYVGDAGGVLTDAVEEATSGLTGMVAGSIAGIIADKLAGDATTVSYDSKGLLLDADEMEGRTRAVAAIADAFEDATREGW